MRFKEGQSPREGAELAENFPQIYLKSGDRIELGDTVFQVNIKIDPAEIPLSFRGTIDLNIDRGEQQPKANL